MHVLFLEIDTQRDWSVASIGPAYLGAIIRRASHEASLLRISEEASVETLAESVRERQPDLIAVSLTSRQWLGAKRLLNGLRERMNIPVIVGGLHPTFSPDATVAEPGVDYVCLGEGERAFLYFIEAMEAGIPITDGLIDNIQATPGIRPALGKPFQPIDDLPFMARDLLDEKHGVVHMCTQRGCPFPCTYCAARMYDQLYAEMEDESGAGAYGRRRSHENVLEEIFQIREQGPLNYIIFLDDTFTIHHPWVYAFCEVYGEQLRIPFSLHARIETMSEKMIERLASAGCRHIVYGVESGSERVRREVMKRPVSNRKIIDVFEQTKEAGILVTANYMMGVPGETLREMRETIDLHATIDPYDFGYFVFYPYPGTALFQLCRDEGYLPEDYLARPARHNASILDLPDVTPDEIASMYDAWTEVRVQHTLKRHDASYIDVHRADITREIVHSADIG